jgi:hypothetical protein
MILIWFWEWRISLLGTNARAAVYQLRTELLMAMVPGNK